MSLSDFVKEAVKRLPQAQVGRAVCAVTKKLLVRREVFIVKKKKKQTNKERKKL